MGGMIRCPNCGKILHSMSRHDFQQCDCTFQTFIDGGEDYSHVGGEDIKDIEFISHIHNPDGEIIVEMKPVIIESPYQGNVPVNEIYGEFCLRDCLVNYNEAPFASHLLYTRKYVLNDNNLEERNLGIRAGFSWRKLCKKTVLYVDLGISEGMRLAIKDCQEKKKKYNVRELSDYLWREFLEVCKLNNFKVERL